MTRKQSGGNFINGIFYNTGTTTLQSFNPSQNYSPVFSVKTDPAHVNQAVNAAKTALSNWNTISLDSRKNYLLALKSSFIKNEQLIAQAISEEMGKILSEALSEAKSLSARIDLMINYGLKRVANEYFYAQRAQTRFHHQGVLAVIGPYNFPAHLVNAHVIPALLMGNTVVVKPSEVCPWVGELYAQCFLEADFPPGVFNLVHGDAGIGKELCAHAQIDGVLFTGSYKTGRILQELLLDQPHKILALEMGGKNIAVVMDDADIKQALLEIIQGAYLTAGQRCTATSRVLVHEKIFNKFLPALLNITRKLNHNFYGPLATKSAQERFLKSLALAREEGAQVLLESQALAGGAFVTPSVYQISSDHPIDGFLSEELFGPHLTIEKFSSLEHAIKRINQSSYGLSNSIFSLDPTNAERIYQETKSGLLNINRSSNGAHGNMPFGGVNRSGNQRPAGIDAVRYSSFPVAMSSLAYGSSSAPAELVNLANLEIEDITPINIIFLRHRIEAIFEVFGINSDYVAQNRVIFSKSTFNNLGAHENIFFVELEKIFGAAWHLSHNYITLKLDHIENPQELLNKLHACLENFGRLCGLSLHEPMHLAINIPSGLNLPRSQAFLDRLYRGNFVPPEKKQLVADLHKSKGAFLASIDDDPLVLFDAASQIATLGSGFLADTFQNAYECGDFDESLIFNYDLAQEFPDDSELFHDAHKARCRLENFLHEKSHKSFMSVAYGSSGAEANEIAFDLCRQNGPGGTRILAFEGSFHGRTLMALQATYNKEKRGPFVFENYEACFLPFPAMATPNEDASFPENFLAELYQGNIPNYPQADQLLKRELATLELLKAEILKGNICCVIIEPMQCEGGDRYASARFFNGLRALTKALKIPLVFDEVQTGFHLGRTFFWHEQFNLRDAHGDRTSPDCMSLGKKAQAGICMSIWPNKRPYTPHIIQLKRGLLQGLALTSEKALSIEKETQKELDRLQEYFPKLILNARAVGFAFAFDMPSNELAMTLINRRFEHGFMAYIAGEKTLRFRLNMTSTQELIIKLFENLFFALAELRDNYITTRSPLCSEKQKIAQFEITNLSKENFPDYAQDIENIENSAYEMGRRDSLENLRSWLSQPCSLGLILKCVINNEEIIGGYAVGGPLEHATVDGCIDDPLRTRADVFYSADITLDARVRGLGLGRLLKEEQIRQVSAMKKSDGSPRYQFMAGRNRVGYAGAMTRINETLGAYIVKVYDHQYGDPQAKAAYYHLPLFKNHRSGLSAPVLPTSSNLVTNCQNSIQMPLSLAPSTLLDSLKKDQLRALACTKLTLSNWATPNLVRYSELLRAFMPQGLNHAYFTSGRDEVVDKGLRSLRFHRPKADIAVGFSHQWLGHTTAAARSLSHDDNQAQPFKFFDWPHVAHPSLVGFEQSLDELKAIISRHGPDRILGIVIELMGEKSGLYFEELFLAKLDEIRKQSDIPLIFVETASAFGRSSRSFFLTDSLSIKPNMIWWYTGGQLGHVLVDDKYFVEKPLTLISTWDGDDLSIARAYHHMLALSNNTHKNILEHFEQRMKVLGAHGLGCWQGIKLKDQETLKKAQTFAQEKNLLLGAGFENTLMICPKPDLKPEIFNYIIKTLECFENLKSSSPSIETTTYA
jgi:succinylglutamate-semialdehyde dehydrogenase